MLERNDARLIVQAIDGLTEEVRTCKKIKENISVLWEGNTPIKVVINDDTYRLKKENVDIIWNGDTPIAAMINGKPYDLKRQFPPAFDE